MRCPKCGCIESKVVDSRRPDAQDVIRRRRECVECGFRFTTYERREELPLNVIKKDGSNEPFNRQKIMNSLVTATVKRNISVSELDKIIDDIESELRDKGITEVKSSHVGEMVLVRLRDLDKVAYVRFASVYRDFRDIEEFATELRSLS